MTLFYMSVVGLVLLSIFVFVVARLAWIFSSRNSNIRAYRVPVTAVAALATIAAMTWDVVFTSVKMDEVCSTEMLVIKRSVKVEGFYANYGSPDMLNGGFKYLESKGVGNKVEVYTKVGDSVVKEVFDSKKYAIKSQYEYIYEAVRGPLDGRQDIGFFKTVVRDRRTGEELGYAVRYTAYPGWVDRNTASLITQVFWMCQGNVNQNAHLRARVLLPE